MTSSVSRYISLFLGVAFQSDRAYAGHVQTGQDSARLATRRSRRLAAVVGVNVVVAFVELGGGLRGHSTALLADASHNATDVVAAALAFVAVRLVRRPPTRSKSFGYHRTGVLAALVNAAVVLVLAVLIAVGAIARLLHPLPVHAPVLVAVALVALAMNGTAALLLMEKGGRDLNLRATTLHMAGDAASSAGVAVAGVALWLWPGLGWIDPAVSLAIALLIAAQALRLGRQVTDVLLEGTPEGTDADVLTRAVVALEGVDEVHDLHVWSLSAEVTLLSAHMVISGHPTLEQAQEVAATVRARLADDFGIAHATLELECETCTDGLADPCAMVPEDVGK